MTRALRMWPLLTGVQRCEKTVSTRGRGQGQFSEAPILAYLVETASGRILCDAGCGERPLCQVHVHRDKRAAARTGLDGGAFADERARAGRGIGAQPRLRFFQPLAAFARWRE